MQQPSVVSEWHDLRKEKGTSKQSNKHPAVRARRMDWRERLLTNIDDPKGALNGSACAYKTNRIRQQRNIRVATQAR